MVLLKFLCATANIFPSMECVDEKNFLSDICGSEKKVPAGPPVCRSQLVTSSQLVDPPSKLVDPPSELVDCH